MQCTSTWGSLQIPFPVSAELQVPTLAQCSAVLLYRAVANSLSSAVHIHTGAPPSRFHLSITSQSVNYVCLAGGRDDGTLSKLLIIGGISVVRAAPAPGPTTSYSALGIPAPPLSQFHVSFGVPVQRLFYSGRREVLWPDEGAAAARIGEECVGRSMLLHEVSAGVQTLVTVIVARYECVQ